MPESQANLYQIDKEETDVKSIDQGSKLLMPVLT